MTVEFTRGPRPFQAKQDGRRAELADIREHLIAHVDQLIALADETNEADHKQIVADKDQKAGMAFHIAGQLIWPLIEWAFFHRIGLHVAKTPSSPVAASLGDNSPECVAMTQGANSAKHEQVGAQYRFDDVNVNRQVIAELVRGMTSFYLKPLTDEVADALEALNRGEVRSMFVPSGSGLHGNGYTASHVRLRILEFVEFHSGLRGKVGEAKAHVAAVIAQSQFTIKSWERRIKAELPHSIIYDRLVMAKAQGEKVRRVHLKQDVDEKAIRWAAELQERYSDEALRDVAEAYRLACVNQKAP